MDLRRATAPGLRVARRIAEGKRYMNLDGAQAFVTGGARRLGREVCLALARAGARVTFTYWHASPADVQRTLDMVQAAGPPARALRCDVACLEDVRRAKTALAQPALPLDVVINSASPFLREELPFADYALWRQVTRASIDGCLHVCNELLPLLRAARAPSIINMLDLTIRHPRRGYTAHAVAKSGLEALTRQLAAELAPQVRVNGIVPGPVLAPAGLSAAGRARVARKTLLGRWGAPADVIRGLRFLVESDYVTGSLLYIDGGENIGVGLS